MFNTLVCSNNFETGSKPNWYTDFVNHFSCAKPDSGSYSGRRKGFLNFGKITPADLANSFYYSGAHDAGDDSATIRFNDCQQLHIHHYRESWHANVCSQSECPEEFVEHSKCHVGLENMSKALRSKK